MKLIVQIPCLNEEKNLADVIKEIPRQISGIDTVEVLVVSDGSTDKTVQIAKQAGADHVIDRKFLRGLAQTFKEGLDFCLAHGADIIVNTDGDNHYNQARMGELVRPIVDGLADVVIAGREVDKLERMPFANKYGNKAGSYVVTRLAGIPGMDVSTGYRAYTREAAMRINILSHHTYTHETFFQLADLKLRIVEVPIKARPVKRKSRLIKSLSSHIKKSMTVILRMTLLYKPLTVFLTIGLIFFFIGVAFGVRFLYFYLTGDGGGHIQSVILAAVLMILGVQILVMGLIASAVGWNRRIIEEALFQVKKIRYREKNNK
ncbi:glycosyltransferase [Patescibacteria group bacterium]